MEPLFNKVAGLHTSNFIKKRLQNRCFPMNIAKFSRTPILKNICEGLLLTVSLRISLTLFEWWYYSVVSLDFQFISETALQRCS